jgi:hypothetical protein
MTVSNHPGEQWRPKSPNPVLKRAATLVMIAGTALSVGGLWQANWSARADTSGTVSSTTGGGSKASSGSCDGPCKPTPKSGSGATIPSTVNFQVPQWSVSANTYHPTSAKPSNPPVSQSPVNQPVPNQVVSRNVPDVVVPSVPPPVVVPPPEPVPVAPTVVVPVPETPAAPVLVALPTSLGAGTAAVIVIVMALLTGVWYFTHRLVAQLTFMRT